MRAVSGAQAWLGASTCRVLAWSHGWTGTGQHGRQSVGRSSSILIRGLPQAASSALGEAESGVHVQRCHELDVHGV